MEVLKASIPEYDLRLVVVPGIIVIFGDSFIMEVRFLLPLFVTASRFVEIEPINLLVISRLPVTAYVTCPQWQSTIGRCVVMLV